MPRVKITDDLRKKIIADYVQNGNLRETARMNGNISPNTVKKIVNENKEFEQLCTQKQEQNTKDILEYMSSNYEKQKKVIDLSLDAMISKLEKDDIFTSLKDIATVYGIIFDKALKYKELKSKNENNLDEINKNLINISDMLNNPQPDRKMEDV